MRKFLVVDWLSQQEILLDPKQVLDLLNDGSKRYTMKDLESDWEHGYTKVLNNFTIRRAA